jgi:hypothetical protein
MKRLPYRTDIRDFLNSKGELANGSPVANNLANYLGSIVEAASGNIKRHGILETNVKCRRRPNRKQCMSTVMAIINNDDSSISWTCRKCDDQGTIYNWQGTMWDRSKEIKKRRVTLPN